MKRGTSPCRAGTRPHAALQRPAPPHFHSKEFPSSSSPETQPGPRPRPSTPRRSSSASRRASRPSGARRFGRGGRRSPSRGFRRTALSRSSWAGPRDPGRAGPSARRGRGRGGRRRGGRSRGPRTGERRRHRTPGGSRASRPPRRARPTRSSRRASRRAARGGRRGRENAPHRSSARRGPRGTRSTGQLPRGPCGVAGASSIPERPRSKSPRAADWSSDWKATWTKTGLRPRPFARRAAISTSKPRSFVGSCASASTNGAPPSASPPQRKAGFSGPVAFATPASRRKPSVTARINFPLALRRKRWAKYGPRPGHGRRESVV